TREVGAGLPGNGPRQPLRPEPEGVSLWEEAASGRLQGAAHDAAEGGDLAAGDPEADRQLGALGLQKHRADRLLAERQPPPRRAREERDTAARDRLLGVRDALLLVGRRA